MTTDSEGLHSVANTDQPNRAADIVFVHGLGGNSHSTWRYGKVGKPGHFFWPKELSKDLPLCGVWTVGYPAGFTGFGKAGMIIEKRAGNLSQKLANQGLGDRPIVFVTHSLGGLIVKHLVVDSQTTPDADRKRIASMVKGIVFCGTPHRGSAFADAAGLFGQLFDVQEHVEEMRANAGPIDLLHDKFVEWHRLNPIPIDTYAENRELFRDRWHGLVSLGIVVPRASANTGIAGYAVRDIDADHLTLVKPQNRQNDVYAGVRRFISSLLAPPTKPENGVAPQSHAQDVRQQESRTVQVEEEFTAPGSAKARPVELAFAEIGLDDTSQPYIVTVYLVSDEPDALVSEIDGLKRQIARDPLVSEAKKQRVRNSDLLQLYTDSSLRASLLSWLAETSFSAYVYFAPRNALTATSAAELQRLFVEEPLVHRLSKKAEVVTTVHGTLADRFASPLRAAVDAVLARFGHTVAIPSSTHTSRRSRALDELVRVVASAVAGHLASPSDRDASPFEYVRTRVRFAQNVATGEKHERDRNPLP